MLAGYIALVRSSWSLHGDTRVLGWGKHQLTKRAHFMIGNDGRSPKSFLEMAAGGPPDLFSCDLLEALEGFRDPLWITFLALASVLLLKANRVQIRCPETWW